jgi:hypothetical protein
MGNRKERKKYSEAKPDKFKQKHNIRETEENKR